MVEVKRKNKVEWRRSPDLKPSNLCLRIRLCSLRRSNGESKAWNDTLVRGGRSFSDPSERKEGFGASQNVLVSSLSTATKLQGTMKRAFSMKRLSSVSERYYRIHDQYMALASPIGEDGEGESNEGRRSVMRRRKKKHNGGGGKILRACKI
ncbi:hypothetical protein K1719_034138 [Acacia pycnantha]|nr:hypothetical protein K1719_034138 [Acacia pycnantha]